MTRSAKIIRIFFAAASCQSAFRHPSFLLGAGERAHLFSGLLCFLTLTIGLVHFQIFDGLLFPQGCWFFSLLLGLIPLRGVDPATAGPRARKNLSCAPEAPIG